MDKVAFISVFNKEGIDQFAKELVGLGWSLMASGGTAKFLKEKGLEVKDLGDIVGGAILGHRVVSLSREFYAMLLARPEDEGDVAELKKLNLPFISLVCCDMYPLEAETKNETATLDSVIEKTDIGGPTMLRAAAKGKRIVIANAEDRMRVIDWLKDGEEDKENFMRDLAAKAEYIVAKYCMTSAEYLGNDKYKAVHGEKEEDCKYGENAYQTPSAAYKDSDDPFGPDKFELLTETPLSYNNFCDRDKPLQTITHIGAGFDKNFGRVPKCIAIAVKHGNACGVGIGENKKEALEKMIEGDVRAIHGGSVITNFDIGEDEAEILIHHQVGEGSRRLLDTITAVNFTDEAIDTLSRKKGKCRIVRNKNLANLGQESLDKSTKFRQIRGGFITQPNYTFVPDLREAQIEGDKDIINKREILEDIILSWAIGSTSNSNTITIVKNGKLIGNGVGQQDRVGAAKLALSRADDARSALANKEEKADLSGAIAYSDSFFPFPDGPKVLTDRGIKIIFSTSGSVNDQKVIDSVVGDGATLVLLPDKEARGFAWH